MAAQPSILKNMSNLVLSKLLVLSVLQDGICRSFHNKATINASALLCVLWQNLDEDSFDMLNKNYCWAAIPDLIWTTNVPYERKMNMLSSIDNNFIICLFDFERFNIESRFLFSFYHTINATKMKICQSIVYQVTIYLALYLTKREATLLFLRVIVHIKLAVES